ncbi:lantibiotic dehydratase [Micromonospora fulviviridis]|uniref:lantibiotic dehydratase n=1 Tax=Micromonospora fulviviridis TaxID=47860 RepID=UPI0037B7531E
MRGYRRGDAEGEGGAHRRLGVVALHQNGSAVCSRADCLFVVADSAAVVRDGRVIVAARSRVGQRTPGMLRETSTRNTAAVGLALRLAACPIRLDQLLARIAHEVPQVPVPTVEAMLHGLIDGAFLITNLRRPMTAVDGLTHVIDVLSSAGAADLPELASSLDQLRAIRQLLLRHNVQSQLIYRGIVHCGRKHERRSFNEHDNIALLNAAHQRLDGPTVFSSIRSTDQ